MPLTKTQTKALELLIARLDPKNPMFAGSREVEAALTGEAKVYFDTYVLPVLRFLLNGEAYYGQADEIRSDHSHRAASASARRAYLKTEAA